MNRNNHNNNQLWLSLGFWCMSEGSPTRPSFGSLEYSTLVHAWNDYLNGWVIESPLPKSFYEPMLQLTYHIFYFGFTILTLLHARYINILWMSTGSSLYTSSLNACIIFKVLLLYSCPVIITLSSMYFSSNINHVPFSQSSITLGKFPSL